MKAFTPEELTFEQGIQRIRTALKKAGLDLENSIVTSRDPSAQSLRKQLKMKNLPKGSEMWQLPVVLNHSLLFLSVMAPNAKMTRHRHEQGPVFRLVISGSIIYDGKELTVGDWMYVPKGKSYSFEAGPLGAAVFYPHPEPW
jgi:hypothetical protein